MRILYVSFDEVPSFKGASTHILSGLRDAIQTNHVTLISLGEVQLPSTTTFRHRPILIQERNFLRRALLFREHIEVILSKEPYDIVHFRGPFEGIPAVKSRIQTLYEVNAFPSIELKYHYRDLPSHVIERMAQWETECLIKANKIICPSARVMNCIVEHAPEINTKKISILPNGYDPISSISKPTFSNNTLKGIYLGTMTPWQGIHWALKAFRDLRSNYSLDIYAPFQKLQWRRMQRRIERYQLQETVRLLPPINKSEFVTILPQYNFAIAPLMKTERNTRQGCCPLKILDYLSHGLPTVASDLFVVRELICDEDYPFFFHPNSVLALKAALMRIADHRGDPTLCDKMRNLLRHHITWNEYSKKLTQLYVSSIDRATVTPY